MSTNKFCLALLQLLVRHSKAENLNIASKKIREVASMGAQMVCLPEDFSFPFDTRYVLENAEPIPGETSDMLSRCAEENNVYLVGGTLSEQENGKLYNTCLVYGPDGSMLGKHRKLHLFNIDIPGKITFRESDLFAAGDSFTTFDTSFCKVGVGICYDIRFSPLAQIYAQLGCKLLVYPAAPNMTTGSMFCQLLPRIRGLDNQVYLVLVSPARNETASYVVWGHSMLVNPSGKVVKLAGIGEEIMLAEVDLDNLSSIRNRDPLDRHRRNDLYKVVSAKTE
ncbi:omega-amidase NIT2-like [Ixodes scapularis]|uniref:omega-amidase NIT2-like n=1 Tax=Ixodes scapularis TaxID=6945 RepID=UPI001A9ECA69|nr:omega-amidase NIT2-like [Ixodes scapularis]